VVHLVVTQSVEELDHEEVALIRAQRVLTGHAWNGAIKTPHFKPSVGATPSM
jgi:hypothetical protein